MKIRTNKNFIFALINLSLSVSCMAQRTEPMNFSYIDFEKEVLEYEPKKKSSISDNAYSKALSIFENTKVSVENDGNNFVVTDYWNITLALALLDEPKENIRLSFQKGVDKNKLSMCDYIDKVVEISPTTNNILTESIPELYTNFAKSCKTMEKQKKINPVIEYQTNQDSIRLVNLMGRIQADDARYRKNMKEYKANIEKQTALDFKNQATIDSLYEIHNAYIGKSIVGQKLSITMWLVVQHSNIEMMKRYIPIIQDAAKKNEIKTTPFKMLIDRVYSIEKGYQIFGSQGGVAKANDSIRNFVMKKYQLN